ncbi:MAG: 7-carboxy-7-deazaguanine synthase QueE [Phycisphaerae bacterium]|nr:radical SAM protein [Phycisphaerae bacterium]MCZ2400255.1 7-carboxy-7-deazaguanine synthase QueE [Phycisphaerae bacterium]
MGSGRLKVNEIFHSIQGEGTRAGERCAFVRLTGCHLRCTYCDSEYSFYDGRWMSVDEILAALRPFQCPLVEVTGGEPLLQPEVYPLLARLLAEHATVMVETSGAISIQQVDPRIVRIVDLKCPSSGEAGRNHWPNIELLTPRDEVKFVIGTREDYEWSLRVIKEYELLRRCPVLMSPVTPARNPEAFSLHKGGLDPAELAAWIIADRLDVRLGVQLHKIVWPGATRGV